MDIAKALKDNCFGKRSNDIYFNAKYVNLTDFNSMMSGIFSCIEQQRFYEEIKFVDFVPSETVARNFCKLIGEDFYIYQWYIGSFEKFDNFSYKEIHDIRITAFGEIKRNKVEYHNKDLIESYKDSHKEIVKKFRRGFITGDEALQEIYDSELDRL